MYQKKSSGTASGGKSTGATRNNVIDRQSRVQKIRYNRVLSPIDENVAYLDLEHYRLGHTRLSEDRTQTTEIDHHPFQNYVDKGSGAKREHKGSNLGHKRRHGMRRRHSDNGSIPHREREHSHEPVALEDIPLKEIISKSHKNKQPELDGEKHDHDSEKRKVTFHKRHLYHTYSDPTAHRSRTRVANADYVGYNVIENFLKESNFASAGDHPKPKVVRSNSEPLMKVPTEFLQKSFFIDAYDDKSKSLEDLNSNTAEKVLAKISDKNTMDGKDNFKRTGKGFEPIEAYRGEIDKYRNSEKNSIEVAYDDQVPSTSKSITQSSLYPGHPMLDPALLGETRIELGKQHPLDFQNSRRVKLTPVKQKEPSSCCPAERKLKKRGFLCFFIIFVLGVTAFVLMTIRGWVRSPWEHIRQLDHHSTNTTPAFANATGL